MTNKKLYQLLQPKSLYQTGSSLWLETPRDIDILAIYDTYQEVQEKVKKFNKEELFEQTGYSILFMPLEWFPDFYIYRYPYLLKEMRLLEGEDLHPDKYDLIKNQEFKKIVINSMYNSILISYSRNLNQKIWYHILTTCYILENNNYELSKEQKENIQRVHDNEKITEELFDYCVNLLKRLKKEIMKNHKLVI